MSPDRHDPPTSTETRDTPKSTETHDTPKSTKTHDAHKSTETHDAHKSTEPQQANRSNEIHYPLKSGKIHRTRENVETHETHISAQTRVEYKNTDVYNSNHSRTSTEALEAHKSTANPFSHKVDKPFSPHETTQTRERRMSSVTPETANFTHMSTETHDAYKFSVTYDCHKSSRKYTDAHDTYKSVHLSTEIHEPLQSGHKSTETHNTNKSSKTPGTTKSAETLDSYKSAEAHDSHRSTHTHDSHKSPQTRESRRATEIHDTDKPTQIQDTFNSTVTNDTDKSVHKSIQKSTETHHYHKSIESHGTHKSTHKFNNTHNPTETHDAHKSTLTRDSPYDSHKSAETHDAYQSTVTYDSYFSTVIHHSDKSKYSTESQMFTEAPESHKSSDAHGSHKPLRTYDDETSTAIHNTHKFTEIHSSHKFSKTHDDEESTKMHDLPIPYNETHNFGKPTVTHDTHKLSQTQESHKYHRATHDSSKPSEIRETKMTTLARASYSSIEGQESKTFTDMHVTYQSTTEHTQTQTVSHYVPKPSEHVVEYETVTIESHLVRSNTVVTVVPTEDVRTVTFSNVKVITTQSKFVGAVSPTLRVKIVTNSNDHVDTFNDANSRYLHKNTDHAVKYETVTINAHEDRSTASDVEVIAVTKVNKATVTDIHSKDIPSYTDTVNYETVTIDQETTTPTVFIIIFPTVSQANVVAVTEIHNHAIPQYTESVTYKSVTIDQKAAASLAGVTASATDSVKTITVYKVDAATVTVHSRDNPEYTENAQYVTVTVKQKMETSPAIVTVSPIHHAKKITVSKNDEITVTGTISHVLPKYTDDGVKYETVTIKRSSPTVLTVLHTKPVKIVTFSNVKEVTVSETISDAMHKYTDKVAKYETVTMDRHSVSSPTIVTVFAPETDKTIKLSTANEIPATVTESLAPADSATIVRYETVTVERQPETSLTVTALPTNYANEKTVSIMKQVTANEVASDVLSRYTDDACVSATVSPITVTPLPVTVTVTLIDITTTSTINIASKAMTPSPSGAICKNGTFQCADPGVSPEFTLCTNGKTQGYRCSPGTVCITSGNQVVCVWPSKKYIRLIFK
ncbi:hypothetical protein K7432_016173 [Basidiobolus ranarum]|uniref:Zonadhesin n=1 Tax=Basidiobolus ranarum TaxID=34480 RepID=A0ABR2VN29_9FUNG